MTQLDMISSDGSIARAADVQRALEHANADAPGWERLALRFLEHFARTSEGRLFTGEDVTRASIDWGMVQPPTTRAWGGIYRAAQAAGIIVRVDSDGKRANGSPCHRYRRA